MVDLCFVLTTGGKGGGGKGGGREGVTPMLCSISYVDTRHKKNATYIDCKKWLV